MSPNTDATRRNFGTSEPNHVRIFHEHQGQYCLNHGHPELPHTTFEDYLAEETRQGYVLTSLTGLVNSPDKIRVITSHHPKEAASQLRLHPDGSPASPVRLAIFKEAGHLYTAAPGPHQGISLDHYLAQQAQQGYHLKSAVGLTEDSPNSRSRKLRVRTDLQARPQPRAENKRLSRQS